MGERSVRIREVKGSNPSISTYKVTPQTQEKPVFSRVRGVFIMLENTRTYMKNMSRDTGPTDISPNTQGYSETTFIIKPENNCLIRTINDKFEQYFLSFWHLKPYARSLILVFIYRCTYAHIHNLVMIQIKSKISDLFI